MSDATTPATDPRGTITNLVYETMIKLLEQIKRDAERGTLTDPMEMYERLCRAEATRLGQFAG